MTSPRYILVLAACTAAVASNPCAGQVEEPVQTEQKLPTPGSDLTLVLSAGYEHIFDMNLDAGDVSINRAGFHFQMRGSATKDIRLEMNFRYLFDNYDYSNATILDPINGNPWENINTFALDGTMEWWLNNDIALFLGLTLDSSGETGSEWSKTVTGGGRFGMIFISGKTLIWGLGLGITSQIENPVLVYPVLILNWQINAQMKLASIAGPVGVASTGLEFSYDLGGGLETGVGLRYEFRRFRLDDSGFAPNGVGEDDSLPFWGRISYHFTPNITADLYGGVILAGHLKVDDFNGDVLTREDADPAPMVALAIRFRF